MFNLEWNQRLEGRPVLSNPIGGTHLITAGITLVWRGGIGSNSRQDELDREGG